MDHTLRYKNTVYDLTMTSWQPLYALPAAINLDDQFSEQFSLNCIFYDFDWVRGYENFKTYYKKLLTETYIAFLRKKAGYYCPNIANSKLLEKSLSSNGILKYLLFISLHSFRSLVILLPQFSNFTILCNFFHKYVVKLLLIRIRYYNFTILTKIFSYNGPKIVQFMT